MTADSGDAAKVAPEIAERINLASGHFYTGDTHEAYAALRRDAPVYRDPASGLFGVMTYDLVEHVSTHTKTFSSANGSRPYIGNINHMIDMDNPAHQKRRGLVSKGFTPRRIAEHEPRLSQLCDDIIDTICERGSADFVRDVAAQLPLIVIADMLGILPEDRHDVLMWSEDMLSGEPPEGNRPLNAEELALRRATGAMGAYHEWASRVVAQRRAEPGDDLISILVNAEIDGARLTDEDIISETLLILIGGDETTRHVIAGGIEQLLVNREHWDRLRADHSGIRLAVEEMLRWVSPIKNMNRTVTGECELGGESLKAGDQLLLMYESANFDEQHFGDPETFRPDREPNDHFAFGVGSHFCLGSNLARMELRVLLDRVLDRLPDLAIAADGPLELRPNFFISGIEHMPVTFAPSAPLGDGKLVTA
ncbi:MAG TPA: cytochrome P450 [Frankiaceae bacterium]|jgi:cytochrome P450 family 142 subfamily A polypeptide 1|nr:cytochrome P450 [Frankiaceae bacterium]